MVSLVNNIEDYISSTFPYTIKKAEVFPRDTFFFIVWLIASQLDSIHDVSCASEGFLSLFDSEVLADRCSGGFENLIESGN
jgi:hypothetical protein